MLSCGNWSLLLECCVMSVLQKCYELAGSEKEHVSATSEAKLKFRLQMTLRALIDGNVNKTSINVILCSDAMLTGEATLDYPFERFHGSQRSLVSNSYNVLENKSNVFHNAWMVNSKWKSIYEKQINVLEDKAALPGLLWVLRQRVQAGCRITVQTDSLVFYYMLLTGRSGASRLCRLDRFIWSLCQAGNFRIAHIWVANENSQQILSQYQSKSALHSPKPWPRKEYNTKLRQFLDSREEGKAIIERPEQIDKILLRCNKYVSDHPSRGSSGQSNKFLCAFKFFIPKMDYNLLLTHNVMVGWTHLKPR